jgi:hypothetical protein
MRPQSVCILAALSLCLLAPVAASAEDAPKVKVILIDGQNNHNWRATTPVLKKFLEDSGRFSVDVSSNLKKGDKPGKVENTVPFPPDLTKYDVLLSNYNGQAWPKQFQASLVERVREGKLGLVVFHAANNCFADWPEFNEMIGMGWRNNKFGDRIFLDSDGKLVRQEKGKGLGAGETSMHPFAVNVRDADHPITKGMPREWMHSADQLVHGLRGPVKNVKVLATAYSAKAKGGTGEHEPMMWTVTYGKGRVFHTPMGHDVKSVSCVGFATALARGAEWVATGKVTIALPKAFPTEKEVRLLK